MPGGAGVATIYSLVGVNGQRMDDQQRQHYRKQANDVIRLTLSHIREARQRVKHLQVGSGDHAGCELTVT
jgi:hypothetical protein